MNFNKFKHTFLKGMKWFLIFEVFMFMLPSNNLREQNYNRASALAHGIVYMPFAVLICGTILIALISFIDSFFKK